jgi:hypothetical protein
MLSAAALLDDAASGMYETVSPRSTRSTSSRIFTPPPLLAVQSPVYDPVDLRKSGDTPAYKNHLHRKK